MENLIYNPSFELDFAAQGSGEVVVAEGWEAGHDPDFGHRPEFKPEVRGQGAGRVLVGGKGQKWFTTFAPHHGWLSQRVENLSMGTIYRLTAWVYVWSSDEDVPGKSRHPGKVWIQVGANPWCDANALARSTQWGLTYVDQYDKWVELECVFRAHLGSAVVFLASTAEFGVKHNDVYWDDARLEALALPGPAPGPGPAEIDYERVRGIVRSELDQTRLTFANPGVIDTLRALET